ncbi:zinc ribbon domain-containing protein [Arcobacter porcinus]|uniref:Zinc ribbon domain protein n=1 Tax=Arcobacter porcinus TaxID=1935204 RepID=A0ABX2YGZ6_9BACT|nr:C4-type zinc ribbon domain-containing protein [Arcobacter porcinus]OCL82915.1 putative zinc ribbon domain protein [Arcobacter porcinus]OCL84456.1 putative zinc ribbon domain protein [Arcobacter porcinus]OCL88997.1 putative zinc ribbon domain protein [Arcobacter porcinus]OCL93561.1 putative zinc ribbon domain protein [Arcobacter porcinus]
MNKYLQDLITLSKYDRSISQFDPEIEKQKAKLAVFVETAEVLKASIDSTYRDIDELKSKRTKNNIHLSDLKSKLDNIAKKNKDVSNEKELKALQLEEEIAKEQVSFANEEIERLDKLTVAKEESLKELKEKLATEEEDIKDIKVVVDNEINSINENRNVVYAQRNELLGNFDKKILTFYEKIKRWAKDTAVVPVKQQACFGCFMKINDKTYAEVIKGEEIVNCLHCGRILYKGEEEAQTIED